MRCRFLRPLAAPRLLAPVSALAVGLTLLAAAAPPASARDEVTPARVAGNDRYATAAAIATLTFQQAEIAHLAVGRKFPDALSATFAAGSGNGPLLLTGRDTVPAPTWGALEQLEVQTVVLVGGTGVISNAAERDIRDAGYATLRLSGSDRDGTAAAVAMLRPRTRGDSTVSASPSWPRG